ncbi:MAG: fimbrillin family protein [Bacteroidaceae bacterium]|nr:fimbrillin family protein [Bacteroidaceae bacterium]
MKKSIFLLGVAVAAMTSCSNDKLLDQAEPIQKAIGFESFVNKGTKAVTETTSPNITNEGTLAGLDQFYVFGYYGNNVEVFDNIPVIASKDAQAIKWDYTNGEPTNLKYWTKNNYYFAAYANKNSSDKLENVLFSGNTLTFSDYTVNDAQDLIADVVNKDNSSYEEYNNKVAFDFQHLLTKIQFTIKNTSNQYKMRIVSIDMTQNGTEANNSNLISNGFASGDANILGGLAIKGLSNKGTCTVTFDESDVISWNASRDATYRNFTPFTATNDASSTTNSEAIFAKLTGNSEANEKATTTYFVMPQNPDNVKFAIKAEFLDDNDQVVTEKIVTGTLKAGILEDKWKPGYFYNYIISLPTSALPIEFDVNNFDGFTTYAGGSLELNPNDPAQGE